MVKTIEKTLITISIIFLMWLAVSYFEILLKHYTNPVYSEYNLCVLMFKHCNNLLKGGIF